MVKRRVTKRSGPIKTIHKSRPATNTVPGTSLTPSRTLPWAGIHEPWCSICSWAYRYENQRMEIKFVSELCPEHRGAGRRSS